jgi:hypothetical protein
VVEIRNFPHNKKIRFFLSNGKTIGFGSEICVKLTQNVWFSAVSKFAIDERRLSPSPRERAGVRGRKRALDLCNGAIPKPYTNSQ